MPEPSAKDPATPEDDSSPVLQATALSKIYHMGDVEVHALRDASLALNTGELMVLLGPSGSGKSTLLNILGGLDQPTAGSLVFRGTDLSHAGPDELTSYRRNHVGFVFQFYNLIPSLTAKENIALVTDIAPEPMDADEALGMVGLEERQDHFPAQLSGGEQQRVAIARAVAKRPTILLCDEPTGALDYETGKLVLQVLEKVNRDTGTTTAIITHNAAIAQLGDRTVKMRSGKIVSQERNTRRASIDEITW